MNLFLDIGTGEFRKTLNGAALPAVKFYAGDVVTLAITLIDARTVVTDEQLAGGKKLRCSLRGYPLTGNPLAVAQLSLTASHTASGQLDLSALAVNQFLEANAPASSTLIDCVFEVQIENSLSTETISQSRSLLARDLVPVATVNAQVVTDNDGTPLTDNDGTPVTDN